LHSIEHVEKAAIPEYIPTALLQRLSTDDTEAVVSRAGTADQAHVERVALAQMARACEAILHVDVALLLGIQLMPGPRLENGEQTWLAGINQWVGGVGAWETYPRGMTIGMDQLGAICRTHAAT
jgi:hypothetical protein